MICPPSRPVTTIPGRRQRWLAEEYLINTYVNTIVCLDETEVIGTFLAEQLADSNRMSLSAGNNISVVTPEYHSMGQMLFRDNKQRMIKDQQVMILAASVTTGKTILRAIESVLYYGGTVCAVCAIFSAVSRVAGMEIKTIFTSRDLPDYRAYEPADCSDVPGRKKGRGNCQQFWIFRVEVKGK